jgi:hypothetical protein
MRFKIALPLFLLVACSSASRPPAGPANAEVSVRLKGPLFFSSSRQANASFDVAIRNRTAVPITVRRVRMATPEMMEYVLRPTEKTFNETLAPGETKTLWLPATFVSSSVGLMPSEPLIVRATIDFEGGGKPFREIFNIIDVQGD